MYLVDNCNLNTEARTQFWLVSADGEPTNNNGIYRVETGPDGVRELKAEVVQGKKLQETLMAHAGGLISQITKENPERLLPATPEQVVNTALRATLFEVAEDVYTAALGGGDFNLDGFQLVSTVGYERGNVQTMIELLQDKEGQFPILAGIFGAFSVAAQEVDFAVLYGASTFTRPGNRGQGLYREGTQLLLNYDATLSENRNQARVSFANVVDGEPSGTAHAMYHINAVQMSIPESRRSQVEFVTFEEDEYGLAMTQTGVIPPASKNDLAQGNKVDLDIIRAMESLPPRYHRRLLEVAAFLIAHLPSAPKDIATIVTDKQLKYFEFMFKRLGFELNIEDDHAVVLSYSNRQNFTALLHAIFAALSQWRAVESFIRGAQKSKPEVQDNGWDGAFDALIEELAEFYQLKRAEAKAAK